MNRGAPVLAGTVLALVVACNPSTTRPPFPPFPDAVVDTIDTVPDVVIDSVRAALMADSIGVRRFDQRDGYLETARIRYDSIADRSAEVIIRVWADPLIGERTIVTAEVVYERIADPSRIPRDREAPVPITHPARPYLERVFHTIRDMFIG